MAVKQVVSAEKNILSISWISFSHTYSLSSWAVWMFFFYSLSPLSFKQIEISFPSTPLLLLPFFAFNPSFPLFASSSSRFTSSNHSLPLHSILFPNPQSAPRSHSFTPRYLLRLLISPFSHRWFTARLPFMDLHAAELSASPRGSQERDL